MRHHEIISNLRHSSFLGASTNHKVSFHINKTASQRIIGVTGWWWLRSWHWHAMHLMMSYILGCVSWSHIPRPAPRHTLTLISSIHACISKVRVIIMLILLNRHTCEWTDNTLLFLDLVFQMLNLLPQLFCLFL